MNEQLTNVSNLMRVAMDNLSQVKTLTTGLTRAYVHVAQAALEDAILKLEEAYTHDRKS